MKEADEKSGFVVLTYSHFFGHHHVTLSAQNEKTSHRFASYVGFSSDCLLKALAEARDMGFGIAQSTIPVIEPDTGVHTLMLRRMVESPTSGV